MQSDLSVFIKDAKLILAAAAEVQLPTTHLQQLPAVSSPHLRAQGIIRRSDIKQFLCLLADVLTPIITRIRD